MHEWIKQLKAMLMRETAVMLVTVVRVNGSAPREVGARMLVSRQVLFGTIGGGNLEFQAIDISRDRLMSENAAIECRTFALGPALGQCCGGSVELMFEYASAEMHWIAGLSDISERSCLCRQVDETGAGRYRILNVDLVSTTVEVSQGPEANLHRAGFIKFDGARWFYETLYLDLPEVWLFGAGHVGKSVVAQLSLLPCRIVWLDQRADMLQIPSIQDSDSTITVRDCETPVDEVSDAPAQTCFVVMTHSHSLDYEICQAVINRGDFQFLGLIGSDSKRKKFVRRLRHRGVPNALVQRLNCPIGSGNIRSRRPESIALSLAMQLSELWESSSLLQNPVSANPDYA